MLPEFFTAFSPSVSGWDSSSFSGLLCIDHSEGNCIFSRVSQKRLDLERGGSEQLCYSIDECRAGLRNHDSFQNVITVPLSLSRVLHTYFSLVKS